MKTILKHNKYVLQRITAIVVFFFIVQLFLRFVFLFIEMDSISVSLSEMFYMFFMGLLYDTAAFSFILIPYMIYLVLLPKNLHFGKFDIFITFSGYYFLLYIFLFDVVAELIFWDEFSVRFNFIAVDYLVYTNEVLANIWESYPIVWLLAGLAVTALIIFHYTKRFLVFKNTAASFPLRLIYGAMYLLIPITFFFTLNLNRAEISANSYVNEITKNGIYSLFSAFISNELDYKKFYLTDYKNEELPSIRTLIGDSKFTTDDPNDITRFISGKGEERRKNVVIVVMESMSANYMERFGDKGNLTPNLDWLSKNSLFFNNTYATGTRTVRGLEAISLSVPPSPGRSIIKRQNNENLSSVGFVFKDRGYDTRFIYGGYGYFDNMNYFFENNGFDIVDRVNFDENEETFANAWGLCDEDLFNKVIKEARASYNKNTPFMHIVMTTSNHRPYTFPKGRDNIPAEGGGRSAGVRYADYAVGKFLKDAKKEPWFNNTVFVFVADHTSGSAGKVELTVKKYHIPLFIYSPSFIESREVSNLTSQIDIAPTILGLLNFSYYSKFYGKNILDNTDNPRAFVANYQKLGLITNDLLIVLKPNKKYAQYHRGMTVPDTDINTSLLMKAIAYYKHAANGAVAR